MADTRYRKVTHLKRSDKRHKKYSFLSFQRAYKIARMLTKNHSPIILFLSRAQRVKTVRSPQTSSSKISQSGSYSISRKIRESLISEDPSKISLSYQLVKKSVGQGLLINLDRASSLDKVKGNQYRQATTQPFKLDFSMKTLQFQMTKIVVTVSLEPTIIWPLQVLYFLKLTLGKIMVTSVVENREKILKTI